TGPGKQALSGAVVAVQRASADGETSPHLHVVLLDGRPPRFRRRLPGVPRDAPAFDHRGDRCAPGCSPPALSHASSAAASSASSVTPMLPSFASMTTS